MKRNLLISVGPKALIWVLLLSLGLAAHAQNPITVKGQILDTDGATPLPGASVVEKGTANGTITDLDGNYQLRVAGQESVLVFSFMGYAPKEVVVGTQSQITVSLAMENIGLDEIVVVGYGQLKKRDVTGSVGSLDNSALVERGVGNPMEAMQGSIAGVQISSASGRVGDEFKITIRGQNSMATTNGPLFVVDGTPTDGISFLNPQDIERIDILKDASSTAIYGSRGSNGVVIVTTKAGSKAKSGISVGYETYYGVRQAARLPKMMSPERWWDYHNAAFIRTVNADPMKVTPEALAARVIGTNNVELARRVEAGESFDWYDAVLQDGLSANNYITVNGINGGTSFNLAVGMQNETGLIENENLNKYTFKTALTHKVNEKFSVGVNITLAHTVQEQGSDVAMREAFRLNPWLNPYGIDGELFPLPGKLTNAEGKFIIDKTSTFNPILAIRNTSDETKRWNMVGNAFAEYKALDWLSFRSAISMGFDYRNRGRAWGALTEFGRANGPSADMTRNQNLNYTWDNQVNANYTLNQKHALALMGLQSIYGSTSENSLLSARGMPFETGFHNIGTGLQNTYNVGSGYAKQTLASFALRANYTYDNKYLLTVSTRWDGSSLLSEGNKWESFPSVALAWRISEEAFMKKLSIVSDLKLRTSYGFTGNNIIAPYSTVNKLDKQMYYDMAGKPVVGWSPSALANNLLTWEKTREANIGLDYGLIDGRISGSIDLYDRLSDGLLMPQQLPRESGWTTINANVGSVSNQGVELALNTVNIDNGLVRWETNFVFSKNVNKIVSLYGQTESDDVGNGWFIGQPIDAQYNYQYAGVWQANEREQAAQYLQSEGQAKVVDQNNDGKIDPNDDRIILGSVSPDWSGSITSRLQVGAFDFSVTAFTNQGVMVYSNFHDNFANVEDRGRQKMDLNYYVPENGAGIPANYTNDYPWPLNSGPYGRANGGAQFYKDASFVKVKNLSLGYNMDPKLLKKINMKSARIYVNVIDPFVFTPYEGYDPEWATASLNVGRVGSITYQVGASIKF